jgi:hypothetical protein
VAGASPSGRRVAGGRRVNPKGSAPRNEGLDTANASDPHGTPPTGGPRHPPEGRQQHRSPLLLVLPACSDSDDRSDGPVGTNAPDASTAPAEPSGGTPTEESRPTGGAVMNTLWLVWTRDDRAAAENLATDDAIDQMWAVPADTRSVYDGGRCESDTACAWIGPDGRWVVRVDDDGRTVVEVEFESS